MYLVRDGRGYFRRDEYVGRSQGFPRQDAAERVPHDRDQHDQTDNITNVKQRARFMLPKCRHAASLMTDKA